MAGCVAFIGFSWAAHSEDIGDVARVANRRVPTTTSVSVNRNPVGTDSVSRTNSATSHTTQNVRGRTTTTTRTPIATEHNNVTTTRNTGNVVSRTTTGTVTARTATPTKTSRTTGRTTTQSRTNSRATTVTREDILNRDYSKCKKVFFDCMDEFCANKDAQLKRCACSSRINEFDSVKKQLDAVEDKMLDFNQKLLTVSMDKEDAAALNVATEGETAFLSTTDKSKSKQTLDAIAKKLNTSFDSSNFDNNNLQVLSWSLDVDAAFDNVDSLMGASTTTKTGTALYSAALPVCRQMAAEVCSASDVSLAEGGYQALIEQDCNTVAKTYQTQTAQARSKVQEGSALLDMSRLDVYQKRNSDDILTCKKKMLDMLTDSTVCGDELGKCLDVTGQYINPTTGEVFLKPELINLTTLLSRPDDNATWSTTAKNSTFVNFLNSKKKFLQPAMEHCENIADAVWDSFIEDALAQIKLAQDNKLDSVRQSCTVLTSQCLSDASATLTNFDARALSTFGIAADKTANTMCSDIINSCTTLLKTSNDGTVIAGNEQTNFGDLWNAGVSEINRKTTYESLMQTCREVGRACIIQVCTSTSGNFGLCENIATSINRKSIINHTACWDEVKNCVRSAGTESITDIFANMLDTDDAGMGINFYDIMYDSGNYDSSKIIQDANDANINACKSYAITKTNDSLELILVPTESTCVFDMCSDDCTGDDLFNCRTCRLAERIWGNCEVPPRADLTATASHNKIKTPSSNNTMSTLLYWFAINTGTESELDNCRDTTCGIGFSYDTKTGSCVSTTEMCFENSEHSNSTYCKAPDQITTGASCQCCKSENQDSAGNCCEGGNTVSMTVGSRNYTFCASSDDSIIITEPYDGTDDNQHVLICDGANAEMTVTNNLPTCHGRLIDVTIISSNGVTAYHYRAPTTESNTPYVHEQFISSQDNGTCEYRKTDTGDTYIWRLKGTNQTLCSEQNPTHWSVVFSNP